LQKNQRIGLDYIMSIGPERRIKFEASDTPSTHRDANIIGIELMQYLETIIKQGEWKFNKCFEYW
jgi:hypothetical protein